MSQAPIGKIQRLPLREVWKHEAYDFTKWLAEHLDVVSEATSVDLSLVEREAPAGSFSVDLVAEDSDGRTVVIENQLGKSDHDHLGKLLTYLSAYDAAVAIWIVGEPRPEHTKALAWLNDSSPADFYLVRAEAIRIGVSEPALLLTPIVGPSEQSKSIALDKQEKSERHRLRREFWTSLLQYANSKTKLHSSVSPRDQLWCGVSAGRSGMSLNYVCKQHEWRVEMYIDVGDKELNTAILDTFKRDEERIIAEFRGELEWQYLPDRRACRITTPWIDSGGYRSEPEAWPEIHREMVDSMTRLEIAIRPILNKLPSNDTLMNSKVHERTAVVA